MARANAAYYATKDPFADFTTAPEISQVFGECLGLWAAMVWDLMGKPSPVILAEAGPGRGTLMADAMRAIGAAAPDFAAALRLHLIETSPRLRAEQATRLDATWHDDLADLPPGPMILLANEFLDALPIRQFIRHEDAWMERWVRDGAFVERPAPDAPTTGAETGTIQERGDAALAWVTALSARLATQGGAALLIDYGPATSGPGDTLQALRHGQVADALADPGAADLTAHVDFAALARATTAQGPVPQALFLARLGFLARTAALSAANPRQAPKLAMAAHRLTAPEAMGRLFKALAICHPDLPPLPGFAA
ncbi:class I SAM-dependent methyltransferase [Humitalea sp. 24SJ18S-53]|uniref:class I SAM-dependent methyltransferase n=1 Tax=Humitalea sp. 24SJ18S-53 TaxID=3422307 RepID=UPI003D667679